VAGDVETDILEGSRIGVAIFHQAAALMSCVQLLADAKANIAKFKATRRNITTEETEAINTSFMSEAHRVIYVSKARCLLL
jgi:hypothetical protein